jgi:ribonuclease HI
VDGYPCARYKKLRTLDEAEAWMQRAAPYPVKQNINPANRVPGEARTSIDSEPSGRAPASSSSSTIKLAASSLLRLDSGSESQIAPDLPSVRSHTAAGQSRMSATAEDVVYTDGACSGNGQLGSVAGIGVWWGVDDPRYVFPSNNDAVHLCMPVW